jgi:ankyrin repeat protein
MNEKTRDYLDGLLRSFPFMREDTNLTVHSRSIFDDTPLHVATRWEDLGIVLALLEDGADIDAVGDYGKTPLHNALQYARHDVVAKLLESGARTDIADCDGTTAVDILRARERSAGRSL